jgi:hypothetical protein
MISQFQNAAAIANDKLILSSDSQVFTWNLKENRVSKLFDSPIEKISSFFVSPCDRYCIMINHNFDALFYQFSPPQVSQPFTKWKENSWKIYKIIFWKNFFVCFIPDGIQVWKLNGINKVELVNLLQEKKMILDLHVMDEETLIYSNLNGSDSKTFIWNFQKNEIVKSINEAGLSFSFLSPSGCGLHKNPYSEHNPQYLLIGDRGLRVWKLAKQEREFNILDIEHKRANKIIRVACNLFLVMGDDGIVVVSADEQSKDRNCEEETNKFHFTPFKKELLFDQFSIKLEYHLCRTSWSDQSASNFMISPNRRVVILGNSKHLQIFDFLATFG